MLAWPHSGFGAHLAPAIHEREALLRVTRSAARNRGAGRAVDGRDGGQRGLGGSAAQARGGGTGTEPTGGHGVSMARGTATGVD